MAGGSFNPLNPPTNPGFYVNFKSVATATVAGGANGVVVVPFTADWGPDGVFVEMESVADYDNAFSSSTNGNGRFAVSGALQGLGGTPGASMVLGYRLCDSSGARATKVLQNGASNETFVTLTAKHKGVRPANWTLTVQTGVVDTATKDLILYESGVEVERFTSLSASSPAAWVAAINGVSNYFTVAAGAASDVANVTTVAFNTTSGNSGLTPVGSDWVAFQTAAESQEFNVLSPAELTDSTIRSALVSWAISRNNDGQRFVLVIGGSAGESLGDANLRSTGAGNENVVNFGYTDLYDADGTTTISTAKFAPRLAGAIAVAGPFSSITAQRFTGVSLKTIPTASALRAAYANGTVMLTSDSLGPKVHQDMTTFVAGTIAKPRAEFGKIKGVMTHHRIQTDLTNTANNSWIGGGNINVGPFQRTLIDGISGYLATLEGVSLIQPGWTVGLDESQDNTGDSISFVYGISTVKSVERIFNTIVLA
jgi:hypothetical protein